MRSATSKPKVIGIILLLSVLLVIPAASVAQDQEQTCNPAAARLAEVMGVGCQDLLDLRAEGYGLGEIMKAWHLSQDIEGIGDWRELLEQKKGEGIGWGQFKMAYRIAGADGDPQALLELKQSGIGWGQIKKARAIEQSGLMGFDEALKAFQGGAGWDEIRNQLGLEEGPPPWAGPKFKDRGGNGPPAWANNDKDKNDGQDE
ncbi:MAG: hypothetical protein JSW55_18460 [Chloroflexota bacterium]|nr:MAG: hypothetical protein JSW55_18460 [Chloroflexota bacterium]